MNILTRRKRGAATTREPSPARGPGSGGLLKRTFRLYRDNIVLFVATVAVFYLPLQIVGRLLTVTAPPLPAIMVSALFTLGASQPLKVTLVHPITAASIATLTSIGARAVASLVLTSLTGLAVVIDRRSRGARMGPAAAASAVLSHIGPLLGAFVWAGARFIVLFLLCPTIVGLVAFIYFLVTWALIPQVVMLDGAGGGAASGRSRALFRGAWRMSSNFFLLVVVLAAVLTFVPTIVVGVILAHTAGQDDLSGSVAVLVIGLLAQPVQATATTVLYRELKGRQAL